MKRFSIRDRLRSFVHAFDGLSILYRNEHNAWIHTGAAVSSIALGVALHISRLEWIIIILCIGLVFMAEIFNTALEYMCNHVHPERHPDIKKIKDLSAAAVLTISITALAVGLMIFLPKMT